MAKTINSLVVYDFIRLPLQIYSSVGIKMFQWDETDIMTVKHKCFLAFILINVVLNLTCKISFAALGKFTSSGQAMQYILYMVFASNCFCKVCFVFFGRKRLYKILKGFEETFPKTRKQREEYRLMKCYSYIMRHAKIMGNNHGFIVLMFIVFPFVQSCIEYFSNHDENQAFTARTPYMLTYPFDATHGIGYVVAYAGQFIGGITISCYFVGSDMLLMCSVYLVTMQYDYLGRRIASFESKGYESDMEELKEVLQRHNILNEAAETINEVFNISILLNYMITILIIVLIGLQIISGSETLDMVKFVGFLSASAIQMYYVCKFGTELMESSSRISDALMGHEWYMADVRYQRMVVLAIARSQKPSYLTAYKFFMISMESYGNLMTTCYQVFTLLKAQMEEREN